MQAEMLNHYFIRNTKHRWKFYDESEETIRRQIAADTNLIASRLFFTPDGDNSFRVGVHLICCHNHESPS